MLTAIRYLSALAVFAAAIWMLATSSSFNSCIERQTTTLIEQAKEKSPPTALSLVDRAAICGRCTSHVIFEYRDGLTVIATAFIALFTFTLWLSTKGMMAATQSAVDLARRDFIATHRPRVILRYIDGPFYDDDGHRIAFITLVNTGASDAVIESVGADLALRRDEDDKWEPPGLDADLKTIEPIVLTCGQRHVIKVTAKTFDGIDKAIARGAWDDHQLCAVGIIRYRDGNDVARDTGFFRVLDDSGESFALSPHDAEMEYQD